MYNSYRFRDKDPIIDRVRSLVQASGLTHVQIANKSGVTTNTLRNWFGGPTKRPQHATIAAVISVLGYHVVFVKKGESNVVPIHKQSHRT